MKVYIYYSKFDSEKEPQGKIFPIRKLYRNWRTNERPNGQKKYKLP